MDDNSFETVSEKTWNESIQNKLNAHVDELTFDKAVEKIVALQNAEFWISK